MPGIGISLFLIAVGAILALAVEVDAEGISLDMVGLILVIVGGIGLLLSLLFWAPFAPYRREDRVVSEGHEHGHIDPHAN